MKNKDINKLRDMAAEVFNATAREAIPSKAPVVIPTDYISYYEAFGAAYYFEHICCPQCTLDAEVSTPSILWDHYEDSVLNDVDNYVTLEVGDYTMAVYAYTTLTEELSAYWEILEH